MLRVLAAEFNSETATQFSIGLTSGTSDLGNGLGITACAILTTLSGQLNVQSRAVVTFGGETSTRYSPPGPTTVVSDVIPFQFDNLHDYYVVIYTNDS